MNLFLISPLASNPTHATGPCPLIALINGLILEGRVSLPEGRDVMVSFEELVTLVKILNPTYPLTL